MKIKKRISGLLVVLLALGILFITVSAFAEDSITPRTLDPVVTGSEQTGARSQDANPANYSNADVRSVVTELQNGANITPSQMLDKLPQGDGKKDAENFPTTSGEVINLRLYDFLTDVKDLVNGSGTYTGTPGTVTIKVPEAVGKDGEDLVIMQINPTTGEIYLIKITAFDSETGEMQATFACYGPYIICSKVPLVDRMPDPDKYPNQDVAKIVKSVSWKNYLSFSEWMKAQGIDSKTFTLEVPAGSGDQKSGSLDHIVEAAETKTTKTVKVADYQGVTLLSDVAVRLGVQDFGYNLNTRIKANLYQDIDRTNWTKILNYAGISYDLEQVKKDPNILSKIEPFVLKEAILYHIDASTGEVSTIYEPTISFQTYREEVGKKIELQDNQDQSSNTTSSLFDHTVYAEMKTVNKNWTWFNVDDIDEDNTSNLKLVISGNGYLGLGPFILFIPEKTSQAQISWWIWIIIAIVVLAVVGFIIYNNKKKKVA